MKRLLSPRSIATVGGAECARVIEECERMGFDGSIVPVHPRRETLAGRPCVRRVADLAEAADAAFVAVPAAAAVEVVRELAALGCGGAVVYSADFAEAGHDGLQRALVEAAGAMPLVGPNCYGLIDAGSGAVLWPDVHGCARLAPGEPGIALVTQSSNVAINLTMQARALPIRRVLTAGNAAQVSLAALAEAALDDPDVTVLAMHLESVGDPQAFARLAHRAHEAGKPIVVLKAGRSEAAAAAARTHTASLAGGHAAHAAFFRHLGLAQVDDLEALLETAALLMVHPRLAGRRVLSMSCSGGEAGLVADAAERRGLAFPPLGDAAEGLAAALGPRVTLANPLDYHTFVWGDRPAMRAMFEAAARVEADAALLVLDWPRGASDDDLAGWHVALETFAEAFADGPIRPIVVSSLPETRAEPIANALRAKGVAWLAGLDATLAAIAAAASLAPPRPFSTLPPLTGPEIHVWDEATSKAALAAHGLVVPRGRTAASVADAAKAADALGYPVCVKAVGLAHKSEADGVRLHLADAAAVETAARELLHLGTAVLVERMAILSGAAGPGVELLVGVSRDPVLGPVMTIGAGGVLAELLADTATLLLPARGEDIAAALADLRIARLLDGWRGADLIDHDALVANIACISQFTVANASTLVELDVNPLIATAYGAVAVDALIVSSEPAPPDEGGAGSGAVSRAATS